MYIEAVTTCVDYSDFLAETLPHNKAVVDRMWVVTAPEDLATQRICAHYDVDVILTDAFEARWGEMHKAKGINVGLDHLLQSDWVLHVDADIVLPPRAKSLMQHADLDKSMLYGVHRRCIYGYDEWCEFRSMPEVQHESYHQIDSKYPRGPAFTSWSKGGYLPVGFFQLWHPTTSGISTYPDEHGAVDRTDVQFGEQWPRAKRALLPEFEVHHLESEKAPQGINWMGRETKPFGPESDEELRRRRHPHHRQHRHRHHHHHHPYSGSNGA